MRTRSLIVGLAVLAMSSAVSLSAQPVIVDIDAVANCATDSSNAVEVNLPAGNWVVTPIDTSGGGAFTAMSVWDSNVGCDASGENCTNGWFMDYKLMAPDVPENGFGVYALYATPEQAFANDAEGTSFMLPTAQTVKFWIEDTPCDDNRGGVSLEITEGVPAMPSGWLMLLAALLLVAGSLYVRRRMAT